MFFLWLRISSREKENEKERRKRRNARERERHDATGALAPAATGALARGVISALAPATNGVQGTNGVMAPAARALNAIKDSGDQTCSCCRFDHKLP